MASSSVFGPSPTPFPGLASPARPAANRRAPARPTSARIRTVPLHSVRLRTALLRTALTLLAVSILLTPAVPAGAAVAGGQRPAEAAATTGTGEHASSPETGLVAYRSVLDALATGSTEAAVEKHLTIDRSFTGTPGGPEERALERAEMELVQSLAGLDARALLPVLTLHVHLFRIHALRREYGAADRHADLAERAAALYAERAGAEGTRVAAEVLTLLGANRLAGGLRQDAHRLLEAALDLDPRQPEALLLLAVDLEREGSYRPAVDLLRRLVEVEPRWIEPRVRLAVNLARTGDGREAEERFAALCADPSAEWGAVLACEERARARLAAAEPEAAARLLREALTRFPDSERLHLALAYALDRGGEPGSALRQVERLADRNTIEGDTPRRRYNQGAQVHHLQELSGRLEARAAENTQVLRAALDRMPKQEAEA